MKYVINNIKLETGFVTHKTGLQIVPEMTVTKTGVFNLLIEDGVIKAIVDGNTELKAEGCRRYDAKGLLAMPSYTEKHCHIDKTYYGEAWRAVTAPRDILSIVESESELYPTFESTVCQRAKRLIDNFIKLGSTTIRTHVDIVKGKKLGNLEQVQEAFASYGSFVDGEIVAFPQHGLLRSDSAEAVSEALRNGATYLGGVDPELIDKDRERSLRQTFEIAAKHNVNIDYHLHESGEIGLASFHSMVKLIEEYKWHNRVEISHGFFLSDLQGGQKEEVAGLMKHYGINLISQVPVNGKCPDFIFFDKHGIKTAFGIDCLNDSWWPYGTGSVLEKLGIFGQINGIRRETELADALKYITGYVTPLDKEGNMQWPKQGDKANFLLVDAECTAHVVGRRLPNKCVIHNGNIAYGSIE